MRGTITDAFHLSANAAGIAGRAGLGGDLTRLRSRSQRVVVSSLVLWIDQRRPQQGGRVLQRMQTPLTFLELLAIALLATAAAGPALVRKEAARPLVVVLDDSYSMLARKPGADGNSPRRQAEIALVKELARDNYVTRFLLAGAQPRQIGQSLRTPAMPAIVWRPGNVRAPGPTSAARSRPRPNWAAAGPESSCSPTSRRR